MNKKPDEAARRQAAQEKRDRATIEGKAAMAEIAAREAFVAKNTLRLRELRLAKEAKEREELANAPPAAPAKAKRKPGAR